MPSKVIIAITVPNQGGFAYNMGVNMAENLAALRAEGRAGNPGIILAKGSQQLRQRNFLITKFLETDAEWLFWWDPDTVVYYPTLLTLLENTERAGALASHPFACLTWPDDRTPQGWVPRPNAFFYNEEKDEYYFPHIVDPDPFFCDATGSGLTFVHRSLFENHPLAPEWHQQPVGTDWGHDIYFFHQARLAGILPPRGVYYDMSIKAQHMKEVPVGWDTYLQANNLGPDGRPRT